MSNLERKNNFPNQNDRIIVKDISFLVNCNATENHAKIIDTLKLLLPQNFDENNITMQNTVGGYNNPIKVIALLVNNKDDINYIIQQFGILLSNHDKSKLHDEFSRRLDEKKIFHFKLKKNSMAKGKLEIFDRSDTIQVSISFYLPRGNKDKINIVDLVEQYLNDLKLLTIPMN